MPRELKNKRDIKQGEKVRVYRNLNNGMLSVMDKTGRVIAHVDQIAIRDASFTVRAAGREKVIREKRKNVHAFVVGKFHSSDIWIVDALRGVTGNRVSYNPYLNPNFVNGSQDRVEVADYVVIRHNGMIQAFSNSEIKEIHRRR